MQARFVEDDYIVFAALFSKKKGPEKHVRFGNAYSHYDICTE